MIFGSQSTASQPAGSGCQVNGGRELAARNDSMSPDSQGERGKKMSDEDLKTKTLGEIKSWGRAPPPPYALCLRGELHGTSGGSTLDFITLRWIC